MLQSIVDAVCDHTPWQVCWINEVYLSRNALEVVARRDRLEYTIESRKRVWDLSRSPSLEALRRDAPVALPDLVEMQDYPDYVDDARRRGTVAAVIVPFSTGDPTDVPRSLSVQSTLPLLEDPRQLPFLHAVASLASMAVRNARQAEVSRRDALESAETLALFSVVTESLAEGRTSDWVAGQIEQRAEVSLVLFDGSGSLAFVGRSPMSFEVDDGAWGLLVREHAAALRELAEGACVGSSTAAPVDVTEILPLPEILRVTASRLPGIPSLGTLISIGRADGAQHASLLPAVASVMLRDQVRFEVERELRADALVELFRPGAAEDSTTARRAEAFGINPSARNALVLLQPSGDGTGRPSRLRMAVAAALRDWSGATAHELDGAVVVFLPADDADSARRRVESLHAQLAPGLTGTGTVTAWAGPCSRLEDYPEAWSECLAAADLARKLGRADPVGIADFGPYRLLLSALGEQDIEVFIRRSIGALLEHDEAHGGEFVATVEAFLQTGGRLQETARALHIHVSTLRYRLDRIRALNGADLTDDDTRFELSLALRLHRLRRGSPGGG